MRVHVAFDPGGKAGARCQRQIEFDVVRLQHLVLRARKARFDAFDFFGYQCRRAIFQMGPFFLDLLRKHRRREFLHQDLDTRLVLVVAAAVAVVHAQHGVKIAQQVLPGQEFTDEVTDDGRAA